MNSLVEKVRKFMKSEGISYLLVNSTNRYLEEYTPLDENSRYFLTGFSGSTGDALVTENDIYLFVDGRYHIQADLEVDHDIVKVVKLQNGQTFLDELAGKIPDGEVLGIFSKKNSQTVTRCSKKIRVSSTNSYYLYTSHHHLKSDTITTLTTFHF